MTEPAPEGIETKDVYSQMTSESGFETKNLPGGYLPAGVPNKDRTGTQKTEAAGDTDAEAAPAESTTTEASDSGSTTGRKTTAAKTTSSK